jgi:hypothetical protein
MPESKGSGILILGLTGWPFSFVLVLVLVLEFVVGVVTSPWRPSDFEISSSPAILLELPP